MTPRVQKKKQTISCLVIYSPMVRYEIIEARNGLLIMTTVFETGMNSSENTMAMLAKTYPNTLPKTKGTTSLSISKGDMREK